jgi:hypothetical protein
MDARLETLLDRIDVALPPYGRQEPTNEACKVAIAKLETLVDNNKLCRSYYRNVNRNCQPEGVAVAFFYDKQLFVGASQCHLARSYRQQGMFPQQVVAALKASRAAFESMHRAYGLIPIVEFADQDSFDKWERHVGQWVAVEAARPLPFELAAAVEAVASEEIRPAYEGWYERCAQESGTTVAEIKDLAKKPRMPHDQMQHLLCKIANTSARALPDLTAWADFRAWLQFTDGGSHVVPQRLWGACVGVISQIVHRQQMAAKQAAAAAAPATAGA